MLTNPVAVRIGLVSYSLYLVHWPLIVYAGYIFGQGSQAAGAKLAVFVLAIVLSELMYRYVETPFRSRNTSLLPVAGYAAALIAHDRLRRLYRQPAGRLALAAIARGAPGSRPAAVRFLAVHAQRAIGLRVRRGQ